MIPVTFNKDDLENEKKGTMRAQDLASMVGLVYPKKVGILDIFDNPISVTNIDLSTTGYVKLTFSKGYLCVYGRLIYVEQGELVTLPLPASTETGSIGIRINLAESGANEVEWFKSAGTLTTNNLLNSPADGVYEFAIYNYTANSTTFTLGTKIAQVLPSIADYLAGANFTTQPLNDNSTKMATTEFVKNVANSQKITITEWSAQGVANDGGNGYDVIFPNHFCIRTGKWRTGAGKTSGVVPLPFYSTTSIIVSPFNENDYNNWKMTVTSYSGSNFTYHTDRDRVDCMFVAFGWKS